MDNSEDFWISAVLKSFYNISTKTPKCPCPEGNPVIPDMCAVSDKSARSHEKAKIGNTTITNDERKKLIKEIAEKFNYKVLISIKPNYVENIYKKYVFGDHLFNLNDSIWKDALFWQ